MYLCNCINISTCPAEEGEIRLAKITTCFTEMRFQGGGAYWNEIIAYPGIKSLSYNITVKWLAKKYLTHTMASGYIHKAPPDKEHIWIQIYC